MNNPVFAQPRIAVVGAGMAGMSAALELHEAGCRVDLYDRMPVLGGRFGVDRLGDRPVMTGGKNLGHKYSALRNFLARLETPRYEMFGINTSRVVDGQLLTLASTQSPWDKLTRLRRLGSVRDLVKLAWLGLLVRRDETNRFLGAPAFAKLAAASDDRLLAAHFGPDIVRKMFRPTTVRMNGAEPDEVYLGTFGTNLSMIMDTYDQLTDGIGPAIAALIQRVTAHTGARVERLIMEGDRVTGLAVSIDGGPVTEHPYDTVVLATPAYATADIVKGDLPRLSEMLEPVRYFPAAVVLVHYERPVFGAKVRAIVLDDGPCSNAGVYGVDDLDIVRYTFSGRLARPAPTEDLLDAWIDDAEQRLFALLGHTRIARKAMVKRIWEAAYCAYVPDHGAFLDRVGDQVAGVEGLELAGDYLRGAALEACCRSGVEAAQRVRNRLTIATA
ncbi:protoporphyrinogen/coproporphyrinogen oxidase [Nocardia crassostreae]|uniref:protoporphyrinogen/coproporphyrinogen oxidase n=1 Tax=Nocardia crassostreae TaxID=53428 RepID=UPI0008297362|nr:FAD-dependent oxidoreductase [Nocardia crassostreae]